MKRQILNGLLMVGLWGAMPVWAVEQDAPLDERVQALKQDIVALNRDLAVLEEELLFPDSAQVSVFLSLEGAEEFRLDTVQLTLDGKVVSNHVYTMTEMQALRRGGVQRLYLGNLKSGKHELQASLAGPGQSGDGFQQTLSFAFHKAPQAKYLELRVKASEIGQQTGLSVREWE